MIRQEIGSREQGAGLVLLRKPMQRAETASGQFVREATTGRVVSVVAAAPVKGKLLMLPRVWAVADTGGAVEVLAPPPATVETEVSEARPGAPEVFAMPDSAHDEEAVMDGAPGLVEVPEEVEVLPVELAFYRKYTEAMLRRYVRLSMAVGRVPSLLGRELFRGHVSSYRMTNFEDVVVFCFDMEKLLGRMRAADQAMIKRIGMQEYKHEEAASMMRMSLRNCRRAYGQAIDRLTELLLEARMLELLER